MLLYVLKKLHSAQNVLLGSKIIVATKAYSLSHTMICVRSHQSLNKFSSYQSKLHARNKINKRVNLDILIGRSKSFSFLEVYNSFLKYELRVVH